MHSFPPVTYLQHPLYLPLTTLTGDLQAHGFVIGVDTWETLFRLLQQVDFNEASTHPDRLKGLLCPLFATNAEQQKLFYYLFDKHMAAHYGQAAAQEKIQAIREIHNDNQELKQVGTYFLMAFAVIVLASILVWAWFEFRPLEERIAFKPQQPPAVQPSIPPADEDAPPPSPNDNVNQLPEKNEPQSSVFVIQPLFDPDPTYFKMNDFWNYRFKLFLVKAGVWVVVAGCGLWIVFLLYRRKRNRLLQRHHNNREALAYWPVKSDEPLHVQLPAQFFQAANDMRRRINYTSPQLDVTASVKATINNGGRFVPQFRQRSRPAEYLVLLPVDHPNNMFVAYLEYLFGLFGKTDIVLHRYYYSNTPDTFQAAPKDKPLNIAGLLYHHANARLILVMDAAVQTPPEVLAEQFSQWNEKSVLLIQPDYVRAWAEHFTAADYFVAEAGLDALQRLIAYWEQEQQGDENDAINYGVPFSVNAPDIKTELLHWFTLTAPGTDPVKMLQWLTACLLLPELHWDILLATGKILAEDDTRLVSLGNLEAICRLPWLRNGDVPVTVREQLCYDDNLLSPQQKQLLLELLIELLGNNLPDDPNTYVYDQRKLHIAFLEAQLLESTRSRSERIRTLKKQAQFTGQFHPTVNLLLNKTTVSPLARLLPDGLKKNVYEGGEPWRGWKPMWGTLGVGAASLLILFLLNTTPKIGNLEAYNSNVFFINTPEKQADYQNHKAAFYYNPYFGDKNFKSEKGSQENRQASALLDSALQVAPLHATTYMNCLIRDYNYALHELQNNKTLTTGVQRNAQLRPLQARMDFAETLVNNDSLTGRLNTDSLRTHFLRLKSQFYFVRWVCGTGVVTKEVGDLYRSKVDTNLIEVGQREVFAIPQKRR